MFSSQTLLGYGAVAVVLATCPAMSARAGEKILFESVHIRFVEVTRWPGQPEVAAATLPSVTVVDAAWPVVESKPLDGRNALSRATGNKAVPPDGRPYPWCQTQGAQSSSRVTVTGEFPQHYYRIDYKRLDGDGLAAHWKDWYPWFLEPKPLVPEIDPKTAAGAPFSKEWPYAIAYNAVTAAPANHYLRYDDSHVQLLEVVIRPGERENMHGHPYPSVFADDGGGFTPVIEGTNEPLDPKSRNPRGEVGAAPPGSRYPTCYAAVPEGPHSASVTGKVPNHFYRVHFKRVDGDEIKANWKTWYR
jgi:hypothetical protein